jgi:GH24 family phage-related lysozyme (muramidase)
MVAIILGSCVLATLFAAHETKNVIIPILTSHKTEIEDTVCPIYPIDQEVLSLDREVLVDFEGFSEQLYQPSERSGPTIGAGLDLGNASPETVRYVLSGIFTSSQLDEALTANGLRGARARTWIERHKKHVKLRSCAKSIVEARQFLYYWKIALNGRPWLANAPSEVKTAITSFVMHTGQVAPLIPSINARDWNQLAETIRSYNDDWGGPESTFFKSRRSQEANLISCQKRHARIDYD